MILLQSPKGSFIFFDYAVVFLAVIANCVVLSAVVGGRFGLSGYRRFLISLTISDLYICLVNILTFGYQIWMLYSATSSAEKCGANFLRALQLAGFFANLLNLCGMSVDHFFGIVYPMQYRYLMSNNAARSAVFLIWILSFSLAFLDFPVNLILYTNVVASTEHANGRLDLPPMNAMPDIRPFRNNSSLNFPAPTFETTTFRYPDNSPINFLLPTLGNLGLDNFDMAEVDKFTAAKSGSNKNLKKFTKKTFLRSVTDSLPQELEEHFGLDNRKQTVPNEEDDSDKLGGDLNLDPADIESFLESVINPNNPFDTNFFDNETNSSSPLNRILLVLQTENQTPDWCTFFSTNKMWLEVCVMVLTLLCFAFLTICYGIIFKKVSDSADTSGRSTRKLIVTTIILLGAFCICWLPFMTFETAMLLIFQWDRDSTNHKTKSFLINFFFLHNMFNSLLMTYPFVDPIIYAVRVPAVQRFIVITYGKYFPCFRPCLGRVHSRHHSFAQSNINTGARAMAQSTEELAVPAGAQQNRQRTNTCNSHKSGGGIRLNNSSSGLAMNHVRLDNFHVNNNNHNASEMSTSTVKKHKKRFSVCASNNKAVGATVPVEYQGRDSVASKHQANGTGSNVFSPGSFAKNIRRLSVAASSITGTGNVTGRHNSQGSFKFTSTSEAGLCLFCIKSNNDGSSLSLEMEAIPSSAKIVDNSEAKNASSVLVFDNKVSDENQVSSDSPPPEIVIRRPSTLTIDEQDGDPDVNIIVLNEDEDGSIAYTINL